jgi:DNA-binding transcriptional ArsR family regulator
MGSPNSATWGKGLQSEPVASRQSNDKPGRPQPIRDAILRYLSEPRSAGEIAEHIERPVPTATGHLRAMIERGLVRRIAFGTYALAAYDGPDVRIPQRRAKSTRELRSRLRSHLGDMCSVRCLHQRTGVSEKAVRVALRDLWLSGLLEGNEATGFRLVKRQRQP